MPREQGDRSPEDLRDRTKRFAVRIVRLYRSLPKSVESQVLGKQLLRSGTSVGAHYRKARRARSTAEFTSKLAVGLQELDETHYWIELLIETEAIRAERLKGLISEIEELIAIFRKSILTARRRPDP